MIYAFVILCLFGSTLSQVAEKHNLSDIEVMKDFDITRFLGTWYVIGRYGGEPYGSKEYDEEENDEDENDEEENDISSENTFKCEREDYICVRQDFSIAPNGSIKNVEDRICEHNSRYDSAVSIVSVPDASEPAKLLFCLANQSLIINYWVLLTDYETFALVHIFEDIASSKPSVQLLSRNPRPSDGIINKANDITKNNIMRSFNFFQDHTLCPYGEQPAWNYT